MAGRGQDAEIACNRAAANSQEVLGAMRSEPRSEDPNLIRSLKIPSWELRTTWAPPPRQRRGFSSPKVSRLVLHCESPGLVGCGWMLIQVVLECRLEPDEPACHRLRAAWPCCQA